MTFDPISAALELGGKLVDHFFPNASDAANARLELAKMLQTGELAHLTSDTQLATAQATINQLEAQSSSLFVSGWRPFVGWSCGTAFAYTGLIGPLLSQLFHIDMPAVDMTSMIVVLTGMLGLGTMRTIEKVRGDGTETKGR